MTISDNILEARVLRNQRIQALNKIHPVVVSVRVNFPGQDKNHSMAYLIFNAFNPRDLSLKYDMYKTYQSDDGPYLLIGLKGIGKDIKDKTVLFENNHKLGRLFDIDVYCDGLSLSRNDLRLCYICGQPAHICVREKKHSFEELYQYISKRVLNVYTGDLKIMIDEAMEEELELEPKFGLVTKHNSGSHKDMDYDLMVKAKQAIVPYFIDTFLLSILMDDDVLKYIDYVVDIGISAEREMYRVTLGVNCYKGLIFHLGLIVFAYGYYMSREIKEDFQSVIKELADKILRRVGQEDSFGQIAYETYQMSGAKGEALSGYFHAIEGLKKHSDLFSRLVYLMVRLEDTNLLKRAGSMDLYLEIKDALRVLDTTDNEAVKILSNRCIDKGLSFGGSADMLVVSILLDKLIKKHEKIYV